jgi:hypothetical protein
VFSIQVSWPPIGTEVFGRMPSGRTRRSALPPRWVWGLPTRIFRRLSSGADKEVCAPAALYPGPPTGVLDWAHIGFLPMQGVWLPLGTRFGRSKRSGGSPGGSLFRKDLAVPCPHASLFIIPNRNGLNGHRGVQEPPLEIQADPMDLMSVVQQVCGSHEAFPILTRPHPPCASWPSTDLACSRPRLKRRSTPLFDPRWKRGLFGSLPHCLSPASSTVLVAGTGVQRKHGCRGILSWRLPSRCFFRLPHLP